MYPAVSPAEMNSSQAQVAPPLSMKQHANGQIAWTGQRMQFATQPQHPGQVQNLTFCSVVFKTRQMAANTRVYWPVNWLTDS